MTKKNEEVNKEGGEKFYNCRYDRVFKKLILDPDNPEVFERLLRECLNVDDVKFIEFLPRELPIRDTRERVKLLDCIAQINGAKVHLEVDTRDSYNVRLRNFMFFSAMYSSDVMRGQNYVDNVTENKNYLHISLVFGSGIKKNAIESFQMRSDIEPHDNLLLKEGKVKYFEIYIDNFKELYYNKDIEGIKKYGLLTFLDLDKEELQDYTKEYGDDMMKDVNERLNGINLDYGFLNGLDQDEEEKALYKADMLFAKQEGIELGRNEGIELGRNEGIELGRNEGIELGRNEGIEQGAEQERVENAANLYKLGVDDDTIIKGTGITKEQLEEIKKNN